MKITLSYGPGYIQAGHYEIPSVTWLREKIQEWADQQPEDAWLQRNHYYDPEELIVWLQQHPDCNQISSERTNFHLGSYALGGIQHTVCPTHTRKSK